MKQSHKDNNIEAAAYIRTATKDASGYNSLKSQEKRIRAFARSHGITISKVYKDDGYSGNSKISERPGLKKLFGDAKRRRFGSIAIASPDRFIRDIDLLDKAIKRIQSYGVDITKAS